MKSTGIVRKLDQLGRLVIPKELRRGLMLSEGDPVEFFIDGDCIVIRGFINNCIFCGNGEDINYFKNKRVCGECLEILKNA